MTDKSEPNKSIFFWNYYRLKYHRNTLKCGNLLNNSLGLKPYYVINSDENKFMDVLIF